MKILITGAKGMLGQELAKYYSNEEVLLWDMEQLDITNETEVANKISDIKPDLLINTAAYNDVDGCEENSSLANKVNGYGPGYLAKALRVSGGILVHYSTGYVFKGDNPKGYREDDQPEPQSAYGRSKYLGEQEVRRNTEMFYIIRLSRLFGRPGASHKGKKSFVELMLTLAQEKKEINAIDEEVDSPTFAKDLAIRTQEIVQKKQPFGIYHVTNEGACTWYGFAKEIFTIINSDVKLNAVSNAYFNRKASRPKYSILLNTKLPFLRTWQEALKEFLTSNS